MSIGFFLKKDHPNYSNYCAFMVGHYIDNDDVHVHLYDQHTMLYDLPRYDINIYLNRYCFIKLSKLIKILKPKCKYGIRSNYDMAVGIDTFKINDYEGSVYDYIHSMFTSSNIQDISSYSHIRYLNNTNNNINNAIFVAFDDHSSNFVEDLTMFNKGYKEVYFNNKLYNIKLNNFEFGKKIIVKITARTWAYWDNKSKTWKKFNKNKRIKKC